MSNDFGRDLRHLAHVEALRGDPRIASFAECLSRDVTAKGIAVGLARLNVAASAEEKASAKSDAASAQIDALQAIKSDSTLGPILSDPGKLMVETLTSAAESAAGVGLDAIKNTATAFMPNIADALGMSVTDLTDAIPFVGQAVAIVSKIISGLAGASEYNREQDTATCMRVMSAFRAVGTGSILGGGDVVPADIFAPVHRMSDMYSEDDVWGKGARDIAASQYIGIGLELDRKGNPMTGPVLGCPVYASTLGQALMLLTEGAQVDVSDVDFKWLKIVVAKNDGWKPRPFVRLFSGGVQSGDENPDKVKPYPTDAASWSKMVADTIAITDDPFRDLVTNITGQKIGIDPKRRSQLQKIRRAIRASYKPGAYGAKSDGGAAMWILYLDIMRDLVKGGFIPPSYISYVLVYRQYAYLAMIPPFGNAVFGWDPKYIEANQSGLHTCAAQATDQILGIVNQWNNAAEPRYAQGQAKIDEAKRIAQDIGYKAGIRANGDSIVDKLRNLLGGA